MTTPDGAVAARRRGASRAPPALWFVLGYGALLVYGTLYPLSGWTLPDQDLPALLRDNLSGPFSRADMLINVLVYMPFGLSLALLRQGRGALAWAAASGFALSLGLELLQVFVPGRTPSLIDLGLNTLGAGAGAAVPFVSSSRFAIGRALRAVRGRWFHAGGITNLGLLGLALWGLSQLSPFVPSLDLANLRHGLRPLWHGWLAPMTVEPLHLMAYASTLLGLGLLAVTLARPGREARVVLAFAVYAATVLLLKVPVVTRQLSLEAAGGCALALAVLAALWRRPPAQRRTLAVLALALGFVAAELRPAGGPDAASSAFAWNLFVSHMLNVHGLADILGAAFPFVALAALVMPIARAPRQAVLGGALLVGVAAFALEWSQQFIPGRHGELTDVLVPVMAWLMAWFALPQASTITARHPR